jgi:hypothetical protein
MPAIRAAGLPSPLVTAAQTCGLSPADRVQPALGEWLHIFIYSKTLFPKHGLNDFVIHDFVKLLLYKVFLLFLAEDQALNDTLPRRTKFSKHWKYC